MTAIEESKTHYSWFCEIPSWMSQKEAEVRLALFEPELPSSVRYFKLADGPRVFENRGPDSSAPSTSYGFCLIMELSGTEDPQILADTAGKIDAALRK